MAITFTREEPQPAKRHTWTLYWHHETDPDSCSRADEASLREAGFVPLAELGRLKARVEALEAAGAPLANAAFNLAQNQALDARTRDSLNAARKAWDKARDRSREPPPGPPAPPNYKPRGVKP